MTNCFVFVLRLLFALHFLTARCQTGPEVISKTSNSLILNFNTVFTTVGADDILLYEISQRSIYSSNWVVIKNDFFNTSEGTFEAQSLLIRVDSGKVLNSGTFRLGIDWAGTSYSDKTSSDHIVVTPDIQWNAASSELRSAIEALSNVVVKSVIRCDESVQAKDIFLGYKAGLESDTGSCPDKALGGYQWSVWIESLDNAGVPSLYEYRNHLGNTWNGVGPQIAVSHSSKGKINPALCFNTVCSYNITQLNPATPYSFRVRALTQSFGFTDYSKATDYVMTLEETVPSKPRPPMVSVINMDVTLLNVSPPAAQGATLIESQYRTVDPLSSWINGPKLNLDTNRQKNTLVFNIVNLLAGKYEARIRVMNQFGYSPYSTSSEQFDIVDMNLMDTMAAIETPINPVEALNILNLQVENNSFTGSNSSFKDISSKFPKEVQNLGLIGDCD